MWVDKNIDLSQHIPDYFSEIYDFSKLLSILDDELKTLQNDYKIFNNNLFLETADESIISKYEKLISISGDTLDTKRENIIQKLCEMPPYSVDIIPQIIKRLTGRNCSISACKNLVIDANFRAFEKDFDITPLIDDIYKVIPANVKLLLNYDYTIYSDISAFDYEKISKYTWDNIHYLL